MKLTPGLAVFGFVLLVAVAAALTGAWSNGAVYGWLVGTVTSAAAVGLLAEARRAWVAIAKRPGNAPSVRDADERA